MCRSILATVAMLLVCTAEPAWAQSCNAGDGVTLWLDFEGAGVVEAASDDSSAMPVQSRLAPSSAVVPPFDSTPSAPQVTRDQAIASIVDRVRTLLQPFAVSVVTTRPDYAPYTRILIGGTQTTIGLSSIEAGLAEIDCRNSIDNDVAFDFAAEQTPDYGGVVGIANVAAHEAGHTFGLEHVTTPTDVMYAAASPDLTLPQLFMLSFAGGAYTSYGGAAASLCGNDPVDEVAVLDCNVGAADDDGDTTPPTLDWPDTGAQVPTSFTVSVNASDDVGVTRVEFYKNLELVASVATPPYTATITAASSEQFYVTVEAIDDAANRATETRAFAAAAAPSNPIDAGVTGGTPPPILTTPATTSSGCSFAGRGAGDGSTLLAICLALYALRALRNRRRQRRVTFERAL